MAVVVAVAVTAGHMVVCWLASPAAGDAAREDLWTICVSRMWRSCSMHEMVNPEMPGMAWSDVRCRWVLSREHRSQDGKMWLDSRSILRLFIGGAPTDGFAR